MLNAEGALKLVLAGPVAVGKTTAIRSITDGEPITTEMPLSNGPMDGKTTTTVAMDYAGIRLEDGTELLVYGLPGQDYFSYMRPIVLRGAVGVVVLLDGRDMDLEANCERWLRLCAEHAPGAAIVVGVTHTDLMSSFSMTRLRVASKCLGRLIPVFTFDARDRGETVQLVRALILSIA